MAVMLALLACSALGAPGPANNPLALEMVRHALRARGPQLKATRVVGKWIKNGVREDYTFEFLPDGRYVESLKGRFREASGFDGKIYWMQDRSGLVQKLDFEDRDDQTALGLLLSDNWILRGHRKFAVNGDKIEMPLGDFGQVLEVKVDKITHLPIQAVFSNRVEPMVFKLSDWKTAGDRRIPMHVEVDSDESMVLEGRSVVPARMRDIHTAAPSSRLNDTSFDPNHSTGVECQFLGRSHLRVHALINGKDVGWFILDSGSAVMIIDKAIADELHLDKVSKGTGIGVGGTVESSGRTVRKFELGPLTIRNLTFGDFDMSQIVGKSNPHIAGVIGTNFFRRAVVELDWKGPHVRAFDRRTYKLAKGAWQTLRFSGGNPVALAQVAGTPKAWYRLDSGGAGFLTLHAPFVSKWKLLEHRQTTEAKANGVGGSVSIRSGNVDWLDFGGHRFQEPKVGFATNLKGTLSDPYMAGNIGIEVLRHFKIVFDYAGGRVAFVPL